MKKLFWILSLFFFCSVQFVVGQRVGPGKPIVQSPYYDGIVLYYALQGINAYPAVSTDPDVVDLQKQMGSSPSKPEQTAPVGTVTNTLFNSIAKSAAPATPVPNPTKTKPSKKTAVNTSDTINSDTTKKDTSNKSLAPAVVANPVYDIIESTTGKILVKGFNGKIDTLMTSANFPFDAGEQKTFITSILVRNANLGNSDDTTIINAYNNNKYLAPYLARIYPITLSKGVPKSVDYPNLYYNYYSTLSTVGGGSINFTNMAVNAYVDYVIDAVNAEIDDAFFIKLKSALDKNVELQKLFPNVLDGISKIRVTNYTQSINLLKSDYQVDIKNLLSNVSQLATLDKYRRLINKHPYLTMIFLTCDVIDYVKKGNIPADILYQINASDYIQKTYANDYSSVVKLAALVSYCLRDIKIGDNNPNTKGWIDQNKIKLLRTNDNFFRLFTGLMAANADSIYFKHGLFDFRTALYDNIDAIVRTRYIVYNFSESAEKIKTDITQAADALKDNNPTQISSYVGFYIKIANELLGLAGNCLAVLPSNSDTAAIVKINEFRSTYIPMLNQANKVIAHIEAKEYNAAVYQTDTLLQELFVGDKDGKDDSTDYRTKKFKEFEVTYLKYGSFIATIASAKTQDDMKTAIKSFALPTGSSRIKKEHYFSIGLNTYVGFTQSWNKLYPPLNLPSQENWLTVPLGLSVTYGMNRFGSLSLFGGIIDVGAIFSYKINSDSAVQANITFAQIFSPSVGLVYGLPIIKKYNIPLSIGANFQWGPTLQKVNHTGNSVLPLMTRRFNLFIAIDIPMINFHVSKQYQNI